MAYWPRKLDPVPDSELSSDGYARVDWERPPSGITKFRDDAIAGRTDPVWRGPLSPVQASRVKSKSFTGEMGDWITKLQTWDWFGTFTFARPISANGAHYVYRRYHDWLQDRSQMLISSFRADEYGPVHGRLHLHALISHRGQNVVPGFCGEKFPPDDHKRRVCCAQHGWPAGYARVFDVDHSRIDSRRKHGASYYVSKYVVKAHGDWDLLGFDHLIDAPPF